MSSKKHVDIIIATKDRDHKLERCLLSLSKSLNFDTTQYFYNVIVVKECDESSSKNSDLSNFFLLLKNPNFTRLNISYIILKNSSNFTKAINTGLLRSLSKRHIPEYIGFLHDDTQVFDGWLEGLLKPLEENVKVLAAGSITANDGLDEQCISKSYELFNIDKLDLLYDEFTESHLESEGGWNHLKHRLDQLNYHIFKKTSDKSSKISLFSALFKKEAFLNIGKFDENLISSFAVEDEFCKRIYDNKFTVALAPQSFVYHQCFRLSDENNDIKNDKLLKDATLYNIKIKHELNPKKSNKRKPYVVYTFAENTKSFEHIFNYHDKDYVRFICFTKADLILGKTWDAINIEPFLKLREFENNLKKLKQFIKLHPHYFFSEFDASMWVNFSSDQISMIPLKVKDFISKIHPEHLFMSLESDRWSCSWQYYVYRLNDGDIINLHKNVFNKNNELGQNVLETYSYYGMPRDIGFMDTSILVMKHTDQDCIEILNNIWKKCQDIAVDDRHWFNFMLWLYKKSYSSIPINLYLKEMYEVNEKVKSLIEMEGK